MLTELPPTNYLIEVDTTRPSALATYTPQLSTMAPGMSLFTVNAIIVLSVDDGSRIFAKYYNQQAPGATAGMP